jgi:hypothetical protein
MSIDYWPIGHMNYWLLFQNIAKTVKHECRVYGITVPALQNGTKGMSYAPKTMKVHTLSTVLTIILTPTMKI